jgi:hypothetical protein
MLRLAGCATASVDQRRDFIGFSPATNPRGETCAEPGDRVKNTSPLSVELAVRPAAGVRYAMSERTSQLITICMLVGALSMIGLALSGTLQMSRLPVAQVATK